MVRRDALFKPAFTMIELIFAIVVMSIAVISLPMMTQVTTKGVDSSIVQEAIFAASAELMGATSYYWDRRSMEDNNVSHLSRVIDVDLDCDADRLRTGHIAQPLHRRCLDSNSTALDNVSDTTFPNLNNAAHTSSAIFLNITLDKSGYKDSYDSNVTISSEDEQGNSDNNIKKITVTVAKSDGTPITALITYSANVGEVDYYKRRF